MKMNAERWRQQCESLGLQVGVDARRLAHVVIDDTGWRNCQQTGDGHGSANETWGDDVRVCMWCRELPGRARKEL